MEFRKWLPLIALVVAVFAFNVSEFMPMGILKEIALDLGRSEADISRIITVYAWAVALLSLPLMLAFRKMDCKKLLLGSILFYAVFQLMSGLSTTYWMLMISRMLSAQGHALFWALAIAVAVRVVDKEHYRLAISMVAVGTSVALIMGVPVGRILGLAFGWQMPFLMIQAVLFFSGIAVACTFPALPANGKFSMGVLPRLLRNRTASVIYVILVVFITGIYTMYSFIEPYLADGVHLDDNWITVLLVVFGLQGIVSGMLIGRSKISRNFLILFSLGGGALSMVLLYLQEDFGLSVIVPIIIWGVCISAFNIVFEGQLLAVVEQEADTVSMALFSALYNVGISLGAILGAATFERSVSSVPLVQTVFTAQAFLAAAAFLLPRLRSAPTGPGA